MDQIQFLQELTAALDAYAWEQAAALADRMVEHLYGSDAGIPTESARSVLKHLRRKRRFHLMRRVADALIQCRPFDPQIQRQYAQAALDLGDLTAALAVLNDLLVSTGLTAEEKAEAEGLIGRAYKQLYLAEAARRPGRRSVALTKALGAYLAVYQKNPQKYIWHGINVAAMLARAEQEGIPAPPGCPDPRQVAEDVLAVVEGRRQRSEADRFDYATGLEACVALGRADHALMWTFLYTADASLATPVDAFELGSTLRQLEEVWRLEPSTDPGRVVLPVLRAELLRREGGSLAVSDKSAPGAAPLLEREAALNEEFKQRTAPGEGFEKVFGHDRYVTVRWYQTGLNRCKAVVRFETEFGQGMGTGFLVAGQDLHASFGDGTVVLTNAHVLSPDMGVTTALRKAEARVTFECVSDAKGQYKVAEILWSSPPNQLDATIFRLDHVPAGATTCPLAAGSLTKPDGYQRVYAIGHPKGGGLSLSIHDNLLLDWEDPWLHYRTPTEPGSSGSPLFDDRWAAIGLHHAGLSAMRKLHGQPGTYEANEGVLLTSIRKAIDEHIASGKGA
jgi:V8-like Glu-specific endopeptidase